MSSASVTIEGQGNLPAHPTLIYPNRVDLRTMEELEKALGGKIAWLVERSCMPGEAVMARLREQRAAGIMADTSRQSREQLAEQVMGYVQAGFHVVLLCGRPTQAKGTLTDVPARLLDFLDGTPLPALPLYAGYANSEPGNALPTEAPYEELYLRFMPQQREGAGLGARVRGAWMEADAEHLARHPLLRETSLPLLLIPALMRHAECRLIDGVDDSTLKYRHLLVLALMFAGYLHRHCSDARLGIILPPGKLCCIANLACLFAGISAVNINYTQGKDAFARTAAAAGLNRFITEERFCHKMDRFPWPSPRDLVFIEHELPAIGRAPYTFWSALTRFGKPQHVLPRLPKPPARPEDEAALFFTGGTEDEPKPVAVSHRMLLASLLQLQNRLSLQAGERTLCALPAYTPLGFVHGLLFPLAYGYDMVTYPSAQAAKRLAKLAGQYGAAFAAMTPDMASDMLREGKAADFEKLRYLVTAGALLPEALVRTAQQQRHVQLLAAYGLTEAAPLAALDLPACEGGNGEGGSARPPEQPAHRAGSVGAPLPGVAVRITDVEREGHSLPTGQLGLIWLKGANVSDRYLGDAHSALRNGWHNTGDIGWLDENGLLTVAGRRMRFSKIGGEMVPHEKLESVLAQIFNIPNREGKLQIAVVGVPDAREGEQIVLLSTLKGDYRATTMRYDLMNAGYPAQWTPQRCIRADAIPMLPNGKLDYPFCFRGVCRMLGIALPRRDD